MNRGFELVVDNHRQHKAEDIVVNLPLRATKTSAGYDFYTPVDLVIPPQAKMFVWTDVKAVMQPGEVLLIDVTSGIGAKKDCMLANTIGVVDQDYYGCESNDGNIGICLRNLRPAIELVGNYFTKSAVLVKGFDEESQQYILSSPEDEHHLEFITVPVPIIRSLVEENTVVFKAGDKVAQGIFVNYLTADNCNGDAERVGGYGSTDTKENTPKKPKSKKKAVLTKKPE